MNAPGKLFVHTGKLGLLCGSKINITGDDTEYIRKDALLDWLKDMIDYSSKERQGAYKNVIDKIESL